jgi:SAM-dependent methyltransferase
MPKTTPFDNYPDEYDNWFVTNKFAFQSELNAIKKVLPVRGRGIEIGLGSGIFAEPLGITEGIEPSRAMREKAKQKNIKVIDTVAENLPYSDKSIDFALMVTTICFVDDIYKSFNEANRILRDTGCLILGFVDKNSPIGKKYLEHKNGSIFYKDATFYGTEDLNEILNNTGFEVEITFQTVFGEIDKIRKVQDVLEGYGQGSFIVIKAKKLRSESLFVTDTVIAVAVNVSGLCITERVHLIYTKKMKILRWSDIPLVGAARGAT